MSDDENQGPQAPDGPEPTTPHPWGPPSQPEQEAQGPVEQPTQQPGPYAGQQGSPYEQPPAQQSFGYPVPPEQQPRTDEPFTQDKRLLPAWLWPAVCVLSLVLGVSGGAVAGYLVSDHDNGGDGSGGVLKVERRTAAPLPADNGSIASVAAKVLPSTVQIIAEYDGDPQGATGSGFIFDKSGHIITNNHVVAEAAGDDGPIEVIDQSGKHFKATVVGRSPIYDIAVLKTDGAKTLTPAAVGSSTQMRVGETVIAIGSPLGLSSSVTSGIVSAVDRPVTVGEGGESSFINAVQTDAAINPGNSGGPLVNLQGQVVGMNSAIATAGGSASGQQGGNIGVGFAIPIEQVQISTDQILRTGKAQYPVIGANVQGTKQLDGARVESVSSGDPASDAGIKVGDVITRIDDKPVTGSSDLVVAIRTHVPGDKVTLSVNRGGKKIQIQVTLDAKTG